MARIYIEGGGDSGSGRAACREGFRKLLEKDARFKGRMPRLVASGSRYEAYDKFRTAFQPTDALTYVALLVDSEDPVEDVERPWAHVKKRDNWDQPSGATDDHLLLMTTCMETLIVADRASLRLHYVKLQESALPSLENLEVQATGDLEKCLMNATKDCANSYRKGDRSFTVLATLNPAVLIVLLPSFERLIRILDGRL